MMAAQSMAGRGGVQAHTHAHACTQARSHMHAHVCMHAGAIANLEVAVCSGSPSTNRLYWHWFCTRHEAAQDTLGRLEVRKGGGGAGQEGARGMHSCTSAPRAHARVSVRP